MLSLEDLYGRYVEWEEQFHEHELASTRIRWIQDHYRQTFQLLSEPDFRDWWSSMSLLQRKYYAQRWEAGFEAWLEETHKHAQHIMKRVAKSGVPAEVRRDIERLMHPLRVVGGEEHS